jgi:hypothetical protein
LEWGVANILDVASTRPPGAPTDFADCRVRRVSTPSSRAAALRGCLVGGCSALVTALAHAVGGGELPSGAALPLLLLVCATVGGAVARAERGGRLAVVAVAILALGGGQILGHLTLALASGHQHGGAIISAPMIATHAVAAILLGLLISVAEHLYVLAASVLCWLRLVVIDRSPTVVGRPWRASETVVVQPVLLRSGLGMRAPPGWSLLGA